jgi:hypothetical protein
MMTDEELQAIREIHRQGYRCTFSEEQQMLNEIERLRDALNEIKQYARQCYRNAEPPMAWRIAEKTTKVLKGSDSDCIRQVLCGNK